MQLPAQQPRGPLKSQQLGRGRDGSRVGDEGTMPSAFRPGRLQRSPPSEAPELGAPELPPPACPAPLPALAVKPHPFSLSCGGSL